MFAFLTSRLGAAVAAFGALAVALTVSHVYAYRAGATSEREAVLARSIEVLRERNRTDDEISRMDDGSLCRALGGRWMPDARSCE